MAKYVHKETGATIDVASVVTGTAWIPIDEVVEKKEQPIKEVIEEETVKEEPTEEFDITEMTVKELREYAKANEIEIPSDAKKDEIIELIAAAFN